MRPTIDHHHSAVALDAAQAAAHALGGVSRVDPMTYDEACAVLNTYVAFGETNTPEAILSRPEIFSALGNPSCGVGSFSFAYFSLRGAWIPVCRRGFDPCRVCWHMCMGADTVFMRNVI